MKNRFFLDSFTVCHDYFTALWQLNRENGGDGALTYIEREREAQNVKGREKGKLEELVVVVGLSTHRSIPSFSSPALLTTSK